MINLYHILELEKEASLEEIKKSFKRLAMLYHPDKNPDNIEAEEKFKLINQAYQILSNLELKQKYDAILNHYLSANEDELPTSSSRRRRRNYTPPAHQEEKEVEKPHMSNIEASIMSIIFVGYLLLFVIAFHKTMSRNYYYFAYHAFHNGNFDEAHHLINRSIGHDHYFAPARYIRGRIYFEFIDSKSDALKDFDLVIENQEKQLPEYYFRRGLVHTALKNKHEAIKDFEKTIDLSDNDSTFVVPILEKILFELKDFDWVLKYCDELENENITFYKRIEFKAKALCFLMRFEEADNLLRKSINNKSQKLKVFTDVADFCGKENEPQKQIKTYQYLQKKYDDLEVNNKLLKLYIAQKQFSNAYHLIHKIEDKSVQSKQFYYSKAKILIEIDSVLAACAAYTKAKSLGFDGKDVSLDALCHEDNFK